MDTGRGAKGDLRKRTARAPETVRALTPMRRKAPQGAEVKTHQKGRGKRRGKEGLTLIFIYRILLILSFHAYSRRRMSTEMRRSSTTCFSGPRMKVMQMIFFID